MKTHLRYVLCGFFIILILFCVSQWKNVYVLFIFTSALIIIGGWNTIRELTVDIREGSFSLKRDLQQVKLSIKNLTDSLNELFVQEEITDAKQLDKDGNYILQYTPIKLSTVIYTGPLSQKEGINFIIDGKKVMLEEWWKNKKPEDYIKHDRPITVRYMRKIER